MLCVPDIYRLGFDLRVVCCKEDAGFDLIYSSFAIIELFVLWLRCLLSGKGWKSVLMFTLWFCLRCRSLLRFCVCDGHVCVWKAGCRLIPVLIVLVIAVI